MNARNRFSEGFNSKTSSNILILRQVATPGGSWYIPLSLLLSSFLGKMEAAILL